MWLFGSKEESKPEKKVTRVVRQMLKKRNGFVASIINNFTEGWATSSITADQLIAKDLKTLRARSREQYYNNAYAKRFVNMCKVNVVGESGIVIQSKIIDSKQKPDKAAQKAIEREFQNWAKRAKNCDYKHRSNFIDIQNMIITSLVVDGEAFVKIVPSGKYGFSLKIIDSELIDINYFDSLNNGNFIKFGIEYNAAGRAVAYYVNSNPIKGSPHGSEYVAVERSRVSADEMLHIFINELPDQNRGIPWMAASLSRLKMLDGFEEASLVNARVSASKMGFFISENGDEYKGEGGDGDLTTNAEAGTFEQLPDGMRLESFDPNYPQGEFEVFCKQVLRGVSSGFGVAYNTLGNNLEGVNFSSIRHGALEERDMWKAIQNVLISQAIMPVYESWLERQYELQTIKIYNASATPISLNRDFDYYLAATYQGRRWDWVDPYKDIQAKKEEYLLNATSLTAIVREKGRDLEDVLEERARENELMQQYGVTPMQVFEKIEEQNNETQE